MKIINLFAGPGAGKSTTAAGLFHLMKLKQMNVELVTEYAKDMVWEKRHNILNDPLYVFAKQHRRIKRLEEMVDYVITDSPLLLSLHYRDPDYPQAFDDLVRQFWSRYENLNFLIDRVKNYNPVGRLQDEDGAITIDNALMRLLQENNIQYQRVKGDAEAPASICGRLGIQL